jgi:hypothetical protein
MQSIDIQHLYNQTYNKLEEITPKNNNAVNYLLEIIERTDHLKQQGITERHIGEFAFKQELPFKNQVLHHVHSPYNGPHYISVFFARLEEYNKLIKKNNFTTPTLEEFYHYQNNQNISADINEAASIGLHLDATQLKEHNKIKNIPTNVAAQEFHKFITDIYAMRCKNPTIAERIATLLYGPIIEKK